jgi:hypothetical protein
MKTRSRYSLILSVLGVLLLMSAGTLEASGPRPASRRGRRAAQEIAELRAAVAGFRAW